MTYLTAAPVATLLVWAQQIEDEIGSDDVATALRLLAQCPDGDLSDVVARIRRQGGATGCGCRGRFHCWYHEGWHDALDALEDELSQRPTPNEGSHDAH